MYYLRLSLLFFLVLFSGFNQQMSKPYFTKWVIDKACFLKVEGSTNINKFSCIIPDYTEPDTLTIYKSKANEPLKISGSMVLNVQDFDCHNPIMTKDLRKTLKAKEFPKLIIRFINLSRYPDHHQADKVNGAVTIELAGVTKRFDIDYKIIPIGNNSLTLIGTRPLNFSDFNIVPPRKIGGMIHTNNELNVVFNLHMKILN